MRLARIVPPQWEGMFPSGPYRMALAHWVLKYPQYVKQIRKEAKYILLDNGAFEGKQVEIADLNRATEIVGADEIVLPDVQGEPKETLQRSWAALGKVQATRVLFVPQGRTYEEWRSCLGAWLTRWKDSTWGKAYTLAIGVVALRKPSGTKPRVGTRAGLLSDVIATGLPFHILGVHSPSEFAERGLPEARTGGSRGVDTSLAFALGAAGGILTPSSAKIPLGSPEKYETLPTHSRRLIHLNLRILIEWVENGNIDANIPTHWIRQTASKWLKYHAEGFAPLEDVMRACGMPKGRYALLKQRNREKYVRQLAHFEKPTGRETLMEVVNA